MQYPRLIVSLALAGMLASGAALAQSSSAPNPTPAPPQPQQPLPAAAPDASNPAPTGAPAFSDLDKKGKGYIQRSDLPKDNDALKEMRAHFNEADKDHNGRVDASEYNAYVNKSSAPQQQ
jgi:hypothetical protein